MTGEKTESAAPILWSPWTITGALIVLVWVTAWLDFEWLAVGLMAAVAVNIVFIVQSWRPL